MPLEIVRSVLRIAGCRQPAIPLPLHSPPPPASSIAMQRLRASWRSSAQRRPARGPLCPGVRAGCCGRSVEKRVSETVRAADGRARVRGSPLRTRKGKRPRKRLPRAFAFLGDRGDRSPERRSVLVGDAVALRLRVALRGPALVRIAQEARRCEAAVVAEGGRHRNGSEIRGFEAVFEKFDRRRPAMGAHVTRVVPALQTFFSHPPVVPTDGAHQCSNGSSAGHTWSRSFGCAPALGCRRSAWNALSSVATGSSRNGRYASFSRSASVPNSCSNACV